jgi:hypothetical protein
MHNAPLMNTPFFFSYPIQMITEIPTCIATEFVTNSKYNKHLLQQSVEPVKPRSSQFKVVTLSSLSQRMPLHWQKGELSFQEDSVLVGSLVITDFIDSNASLSLAFWEEFVSTNGLKAWENQCWEKIKRVNDSLLTCATQ